MSILKKILKEKSTIPYFLRIMNCKPIKIEQIENTNNVKKKFISYKSLFIVFFIISSYTFSQQNIFKIYYNYINKAEICIVNRNLEKSILYYDSAFNVVNIPLAKDIHNAIICAKNIRNKKQEDKFIALMIEKKALKPSYYRKYFFRISSKQRKRIKEKYENRKKSSDYIMFEQLFKSDQKIRTRNNYINGVNNIKKTDLNSYKIFINYITNNSFPNESLFIDRPCYGNFLNIFLLHWHQQGFNIDSIILDAVYKLKIPNIMYAEINDLESSLLTNSKYGLVTSVKYKNKKYFIKRKREVISNINIRRANIGLDSYEDYIKKISFFKKNKKYCYNYSNSTIYVSGANGYKLLKTLTDDKQ